MLIVGGGAVAQRKAELMLQAGATLIIVAPQILPSLAVMVRNHGGVIYQRRYIPSDVDGCTIIISATDDDILNTQVYHDGRTAKIAVNVVDNPTLCDFIFPSIVNRSPLVVAVSSSGTSPVLARRVRAKIEMMLPSTIANIAQFCERFREHIKQFLPATKRRLFWERVIDGNVAEAILAGRNNDSQQLLDEALAQYIKDERTPGEVYLIGAGPGDSDLLTFRAHRLLQKADVVLYDRLVSPQILDLARRDAERIFVGKRRGEHVLSQEDINALLIERAQQGQKVARLKGGDPFIFGRGGEEMLALQAADIPCYIVPGITAATGCAAAAGIPLTYRKIARGVRFCTAYTHDLENLDYWHQLATEKNTLVFYMAAAVLPDVIEKLIQAGLKKQTPIAVISAGTTPQQTVNRGTLENIIFRVKNQMLSPTLIIIGAVADLQPTILSSINMPLPKDVSAWHKNHQTHVTT